MTDALFFWAVGALKSIQRCATDVAAVDTANLYVIWPHGLLREQIVGECL